MRRLCHHLAGNADVLCVVDMEVGVDVLDAHRDGFCRHAFCLRLERPPGLAYGGTLELAGKVGGLLVGDADGATSLDIEEDPG